MASTKGDPVCGCEAALPLSLLTACRYDDGIDLKNFKKMKHSSYKGGVPVAQRIRKASAGPVPPAGARAAPKPKPAPSQPPAASAAPLKSAPAAAPAAAAPAVLKAPKFKMVHRGEFDMMDTMAASTSVVTRRPKASAHAPPPCKQHCRSCSYTTTLQTTHAHCRFSVV